VANTDNITKNKLRLEANKQKKSTKKKILCIGIPLLLLLFTFAKPIIFPIGAIILIIIYFIPQGNTILHAGAEGEDQAIEIFSILPSEFTIYNQVNLPTKKSRTGYNEADIIIWGPNAIFVVEVKHNNSTISGSETDHEWKIDKIGRGGTPYSSSMRNPIKQVKKLVWLLGNYLSEKEAKPWIQGIVLFTNNNSTINVHGDTSVPVLESYNVNEYIRNFRKRSKPELIEKSKNELINLKSRSLGQN
jgi:hypothetical protein